MSVFLHTSLFDHQKPQVAHQLWLRSEEVTTEHSRLTAVCVCEYHFCLCRPSSFGYDNKFSISECFQQATVDRLNVVPQLYTSLTVKTSALARRNDASQSTTGRVDGVCDHDGSGRRQSFVPLLDPWLVHTCVTLLTLLLLGIWW